MEFPEVFSTFNPCPATEEVNSGEQITEPSGYVPAHIEIQDMILAGMKTEEIRRERYDFLTSEEGKDFMDPTRSPNFDLADASFLEKQTKALMRQKRVDLLAKAEAQLKAEAAAAAVAAAKKE